MTKEEYECLRKAGYLSSPYDTLYVNGSPVATFDPVSPMICQSKQIAYDMADLANAYCSEPHTEPAARMDDICTQFAQVAYNMAETPYNEAREKSYATVNLYVPLKPKGVLEDFWDSLDISEQCDIVVAMWMSFVCGVVIPFCIMWLVCDKLLPFF